MSGKDVTETILEQERLQSLTIELNKKWKANESPRNHTMTEIRVSKIEAAKRQIELSIRLLFQNEDPIGILTLAAAGFRILRDLGERQMLRHITISKR